MGYFGLYKIIKALGLLVVAFFVLLGASKTNSKGLKQFGKFLAIALSAVGAILIVCAVYSSLTGSPRKFKGPMSKGPMSKGSMSRMTKPCR